MLTRVNGPAVVLSSRVRSRSELLLPVSIMLSRYTVPYSVLYVLTRALPLPVDCVIFLLRSPRSRQSSLLKGGNIHVESQERIIYDSCFLRVTDILKVFGDASQHSTDDPCSQF